MDSRRDEGKADEVMLTRTTQHGIPRTSATTLDKSEQAREKERKQIAQYKALEQDVVARVSPT